MNVMKEIFQY